MSDGLYEAYGYCINTRNPPDLHSSLARLVADEMRLHKTIDRVAQAVVFRVKEQYRETCRRDRKDGKLDDMTLIIQNFTYPMGMRPVAEHNDSPGFRYESMPAGSPPHFYPHMMPSPSGGVFIEENPLHSTGRQQSSVHYQQPGSSMATGRSTGSLAQPGGDNVQPLVQQMSGLNIKPKELFPPNDGQPAAASGNRLRELTKEEAESGKFIKPYIVFPNDFPFDLTLDSI